MDWTNIIMTLITSGAFTTIYLLGDKKTSSVLDNVSKTIDQWQELVKEVKQELLEQREEFRNTKAEYDARLVTKGNKIDSLYKEIAVLRDRNDKLSSNVARLTIIRCWNISCGKRHPPIAPKTRIPNPDDVKELNEQLGIE